MWIYILTLLSVPPVYLALVVIPWFIQVRKCWTAIVHLAPVPNPHWFLGVLGIFKGPTGEGVRQLWEWTEQMPKNFAFLIPFRPALMVHHPETVKVILKTTEPKGLIAATGTGYKLLVPWIGDGLLNSSGTKWQQNRRLLTAGFHFDVLKPYIQIYNSCVENTMASLYQESQKHGSVEIHKPVSMCTLNVILQCAFSFEGDMQKNSKHSQKYLETVLEISRLVVRRLLNPALYLDFIYKLTSDGRNFFKGCTYSHNIANELIHNRRKMLEQDPECSKSKKYVDFLDILLLAKDEDGQSLTDIEIRDEVETFMFEGHDTTASGITWILYNLARHPEIQLKVQAEIDDVMGSNDCLQWDDMSRLPYLTMCIKESLRYHPPVPNTSRELSKMTVIDGVEVLAGTIIDINILNLHHNPTVWGKDHLTYNPDRFLPDNMANMDPYAFIPFSAGPRNCIGQVFAMNELKVVVGRILHEYNLRVDEDHKVDMVPDMILRPQNGIKLKFIKRH